MVFEENCVYFKNKDIESVGGNFMRYVIYISRNVLIVVKEDLSELSFFLRYYLSFSLFIVFVEIYGYVLYEVMGVLNFNS